MQFDKVRQATVRREPSRDCRLLELEAERLGSLAARNRRRIYAWIRVN